MSRKNKLTIITIVLLCASIVFTVLVKKIDVAPIGPEGSIVGFSKMNSFIHNLVGVNLSWYEITTYIGILPFGLALYYAFIGIKELIEKKSIRKVDKKLIALGIFYVIIMCIYCFFEKVIINFRPILIDGKLEASYPSSHTLLALCICGSSLKVSKYFIKNERIRKIVNILTTIIMIIIFIGRIISGVHWASDIIGGIIISSFMLSLLNMSVYYIEKD